jgi:hypothetical protein
LPFRNKKIEPGDRARGMGLWRLQKQTTHTHIANLRNIFAATALPIHPNVSRGLYS